MLIPAGPPNLLHPPGRPFLPDDHPLAHIERGLANNDGIERNEDNHICCRCVKKTRVILATPCAHLLCMGCAARSRTACTAPGCGQAYAMQSREDPARRQDNPNPLADVPVQLIEFQPAFVQRGARGAAEGTWQRTWTSTESSTSKGKHLLLRLAEIDASVRPAQPRPKVIVFSQFWEHMHVLHLQLERQGVQHATFGGDSEKKGNMRQQEKAVALRK